MGVYARPGPCAGATSTGAAGTGGREPASAPQPLHSQSNEAGAAQAQLPAAPSWPAQLRSPPRRRWRCRRRPSQRWSRCRRRRCRRANSPRASPPRVCRWMRRCPPRVRRWMWRWRCLPQPGRAPAARAARGRRCRVASEAGVAAPATAASWQRLPPGPALHLPCAAAQNDARTGVHSLQPGPASPAAVKHTDVKHASKTAIDAPCTPCSRWTARTRSRTWSRCSRWCLASCSWGWRGIPAHTRTQG